MAHSDALIFLTNITWIFFLFLFTYFFFVSFALPTFYGRFRTRAIVAYYAGRQTFFVRHSILAAMYVRSEMLVEMAAALSQRVTQFSPFFMGADRPHISPLQICDLDEHATRKGLSTDLTERTDVSGWADEGLYSENPTTGVSLVTDRKNRVPALTSLPSLVSTGN